MDGEDRDMTATQTASTRIRSGMAPGLAIYVTAREYGRSTRDVAAGLRARRRKPQPSTEAWWNR